MYDRSSSKPLLRKGINVRTAKNLLFQNTDIFSRFLSATHNQHPLVPDEAHHLHPHFMFKRAKATELSTATAFRSSIRTLLASVDPELISNVADTPGSDTQLSNPNSASNKKLRDIMEAVVRRNLFFENKILMGAVAYILFSCSRAPSCYRFRAWTLASHDECRS
jgi:hypothetical protein